MEYPPLTSALDCKIYHQNGLDQQNLQPGGEGSHHQNLLGKYTEVYFVGQFLGRVGAGGGIGENDYKIMVMVLI